MPNSKQGPGDGTTDPPRSERRVDAETAQQILDVFPDMVIRIHRDGTYLQFLAPEGHQSIVPREHMVGRNIREIMPEWFAEQTIEIVEQVLTTRRTIVKITRIVSPIHGGAPRDFEGKHVPVGNDEVVIFTREVTAQQRSEDALRESEERFRSLVESGSDPFYAINRDGKLLYVNQRACDTLGYTREELLALTVWDIAVDPDRARFDAAFEGIDMPEIQEGVHRRRDGTTFPVEIRATIAVLDGEPCRFSHVHDITERKRAERTQLEAHDLLEQRVLQRTKELDGANRQLQEELEERLRTQGALAEENAFRQAIEESTGAGITAINLDLEVIHVNRAFCELVGLSAAEVLGSTPPYPWWPPELVETYLTQSTDLLSEARAGVDIQLDRYFQRPDGTRFDVLLQASILSDRGKHQIGWLWHTHDVTVRNKTAQALHSSQERLARTLALTPEAVISVDEDHCITLFNLWAEDVFGYSANEVIGQHLDMLLPESARAVHRGHISNFGKEAAHSRSMGQRSEISGVRKGGIEFPAEASIMKLGLNGETVYTVMLRDITERKQAERELLEANRRLSETLEALQQTQEQVIQQERLTALGTMASGIAHDFNNKLVPILAYSDLLLNSPDMLRDGETVKQVLESVRQAALEGRDVVGRLREFYRAHDEQQFAVLDISDLARHVLDLTEPKWRGQAQAEGTTELQDALFVSGDEPGLREMLTNLIFNAVDAMPAGGTVAVKTYQDSEDAVIEVADTGVGMTDGVRLRSLEPFFSTKGDKGTGLGLAVVHGVVQRHGGSVDIKSEPGQGSTFVIKFPIAGAQEAEPEAEEPTVRSMARKRVLVVDDGEIPLRLAEEMLTEAGHDVVAVRSGMEALERFTADSFDVVITDRAMPGLNGDDVAAAVKRVAPEMPVIMLTGFGAMMEYSGEHPESVDLIVTKPFTMNELNEALSKVGGAARA